MKITLLAHHIEWDTDGDIDAARALPSKMEVEVDLDAVECLFPVSINDQICNQLSDATGFCVLGYKLQGYSTEAAFALEMSNTQQQNEAEEEVSAEADDFKLDDEWLSISKRAREEVENRFK